MIHNPKISIDAIAHIFGEINAGIDDLTSIPLSGGGVAVFATPMEDGSTNTAFCFACDRAIQGRDTFYIPQESFEAIKRIFWDSPNDMYSIFFVALKDQQYGVLDDDHIHRLLPDLPLGVVTKAEKVGSETGLYPISLFDFDILPLNSVRDFYSGEFMGLHKYAALEMQRLHAPKH